MGRSETGPTLKPVLPGEGWLVDRWRGDEPLRAPAAPAAGYTGDRAEAFWCFDGETARAIEAYHAASRGKKNQQVDYLQEGRLAPISTTHAGVELKFIPDADGVTFHLAGEFIAPLPPKPPVAAKDKPPAPVVVTPAVAAAGTHAPGTAQLARITGPVRQIAPDIFRVQFSRTASTTDSRSHDVWLVASHPGDGDYKGAVQQAVLKLPRNGEGGEQRILFPAIPDQPLGAKMVRLAATSDAGVPVSYYVREGPAYIDGDILHFTALPPRAKLPVTVTVVAWQFGRGTEPRLKAAEPVECRFRLGTVPVSPAK